MSIFDDIRNRAEYNPKASASWFWDNVRQMAKGTKAIKPLTMLGDNQSHQRGFVQPGSMYMFTYSAKYRDKMPYFDAFPLIIPLSVQVTTFVGINLHYMDPGSRAYLLDYLSKYLNNHEMDASTRMFFTWNMIKNSPVAPILNNCVKKYLKGYVKSMFIKIPPRDWSSAIFLPTERFKFGGSRGAAELPVFN